MLLLVSVVATIAVVAVIVYRRRRAKVGGQKPNTFTSIGEFVYIVSY